MPLNETTQSAQPSGDATVPPATVATTDAGGGVNAPSTEHETVAIPKTQPGRAAWDEIVEAMQDAHRDALRLGDKVGTVKTIMQTIPWTFNSDLYGKHDTVTTNVVTAHSKLQETESLLKNIADNVCEIDQYNEKTLWWWSKKEKK